MLVPRGDEAYEEDRVSFFFLFFLFWIYSTENHIDARGVNLCDLQNRKG